MIETVYIVRAETG